MCLTEKGVEYTITEVNPFSETVSKAYLELNPFKQVPTLIHNGFVLYETSAITRYIDESFSGIPLQPDTPKARARMSQIISVIASQAYWPLVRQVFSQRIFEPALGEIPDETEIRAGLESSFIVLTALDKIAAEGLQLNGCDFSLADIHLAPMIDYFTMAPEGKDMVSQFANLSSWWNGINQRKSFIDTRPDLSKIQS